MGRHAQQIGFVFFDGIHKFVFGCIHAEVVDHKPGAAQHHDTQIFANIVQIALHRAHNDRAYRLDTRG